MKFKLTILMTIFLSGCGSKSSLSIYQSTEAQAVVENPSLIVLPIGMEVYGLNQDSQHELRSDWSDAASSTFAPALKEILRTRREIQQVVFMDDLESEIGAVGAEFVRQVEMYSVITQLAERELSAYVIPQEIMAQLDLGDFEADYALFVGLSYLQSRMVNRLETAAGVILLAGILFGDEADEPSTPAPAPAPAPAPSGQESNVQYFLAESHTALIDLRDGRVIWANHDPSLHRLATHTDGLHLEDEWRFWTSGMGSMRWTLGEDFLSEFPLWVAAAPDDGKL